MSTCAAVLRSIVLHTLTAVMFDVYCWLLAPSVFAFLIFLEKSCTTSQHRDGVCYGFLRYLNYYSNELLCVPVQLSSQKD